MRRLAFAMAFLAAGAFSACGKRAPTGPAWPKLHEAEKDGGESLEPKGSQVAVTAETEGSADDTPAKTDDDAKPEADKGSGDDHADDDKSDASDGSDSDDDSTDDSVTSDEIVIDVGDTDE